MCFLSCLLFTAGLLNSKCLGRLLVRPNTEWRGFYKQDLWHLCHTSVETLVSAAFQSKRTAIKCRIAGKELNFSSILTVFLLSTGTDLLILEGQTGPAHNNTGVARSIFPREREAHLFGMTVAEGLIVPQLWCFCYHTDKLTLYPVTSDSFSIVLTCSQFRKILELLSFHSMFSGGRFGAAEQAIMQIM